MACLPHVGQGVAIGVSIQGVFGGSEDIIEQHGGETAVRGGRARPVLQAQLGTGRLAIKRQIDARQDVIDPHIICSSHEVTPDCQPQPILGPPSCVLEVVVRRAACSPAQTHPERLLLGSPVQS